MASEYKFKIYYLAAGVDSYLKKVQTIVIMASTYREATYRLYNWFSRFDDIAVNTYRVTVSFLHSSFYTSYTEPRILYNVPVDFLLDTKSSLGGGSLK